MTYNMHVYTSLRINVSFIGLTAFGQKSGKVITRYCHRSNQQGTSIKPNYDAVIVGAGHNGLVAASYLQKAGLNVCVLERRHLLGGAAVTEEIIPGFKFSRASYVLSLLRSQVFNDLELKKHGLKILIRNPNSFTPICDSNQSKSLMLGRDSEENAKQIAQFSYKDAEAYVKYSSQLERIVNALNQLIDTPPLDTSSFVGSSNPLLQAWKNRVPLKALLSTGIQLGKETITFYEYLTSPAAKILNRWFESDVLKATLATDAVVGAMTSPMLPGSGYVLLHHVMGELDGMKGAWAYVEGGMGAVSEAIANCARSFGADLFTNKPVKEILVDNNGVARGVVLQDGTHIQSKLVLSNATAKVTYIDLVDKRALPEEFRSAIGSVDYTSPVTKINVAVSKIPNFRVSPNKYDDKPMPHHRGSIHLNCHSMKMLHQAYLDATTSNYSKRPLIEMTIPSSVDHTLAPPGCHVVQLFTQYTPYYFSDGSEWTEERKNEYADAVFDSIEYYAPGFKASVIGRDVLTPPDLEKIFGLTGGNIFHGAMSLDQLYFCRPAASCSTYSSPIAGLYLCGSGAHPGGGVMGSAGRLAALAALKKFKA